MFNFFVCHNPGELSVNYAHTVFELKRPAVVLNVDVGVGSRSVKLLSVEVECNINYKRTVLFTLELLREPSVAVYALVYLPEFNKVETVIKPGFESAVVCFAVRSLQRVVNPQLVVRYV